MKPNLWRTFLKSDSGQTTTEYILILAVVVTIFMQFRKRLGALVNKLFVKVDDDVNKVMDDMDSWDG